MKKREITIPTLVGLVVVVGGLLSGLWLVQRQLFQSSKAAAELEPKNLVVANVSDTGFAVGWVTDKAATGYVQYGEGGDSLDLVVSDDRDQQKGSVDNYFTHFVTVKGLKPDTSYSFRIGSGGEDYDQGGVPYEVKTGAIVIDPPPADVAYGQVVTASGEPADGAIVYVQIPGGNISAAMVKPSGSWVIPLSTVRNNDLSGFVSYDKSVTQIDISVDGGPMGRSNIVSTTGNDSPVPEIVLGEDRSYIGVGKNEVDTTDQESKIAPLGQLPDGEEKELKLSTPISGEEVNSSRPEIIGTAPAGSEVTIEIHSEAIISGTATADSTGQFNFSVPTDLPPGEHTVTISTVVNGVVQRISRTFVVQAQGESFDPTFSATPSATLSPSVSPTRTPTPSVTPRASTTPTRTPTPRPSTTITPTVTPATSITTTPTKTPTPTIVSAGGDTLPNSGAAEMTVGMLLFGTGLMICGWWWYQKAG